MTQAQTEWKNSLDWQKVGPKLIAALEDIDWALSSEKPDEARKIIAKVFAEIGRDKLDEVPE